MSLPRLSSILACMYLAFSNDSIVWGIFCKREVNIFRYIIIYTFVHLKNPLYIIYSVFNTNACVVFGLLICSSVQRSYCGS